MSVKNFKAGKRKRATTHGFLVRQATTKGKTLIRRRRQKGRTKLSA